MAGFIGRAGLGDVLEAQQWQVVNRSSSASLVALAADGPTAYGLRPRRMVVDELGQWSDTPKTESFWQAPWSGVGKVPDCKVAVITTEPAPGTLGHRVL
jgi:phage terminase large subunit-like protein